jgi:hypothetical protein
VKEFKPYHWKILARLLDMLGERLGAAGCNDFDLGEFGMTRAEMDEMVKAYHEHNGDPEEYEPGRNIEELRFDLADFCVAGLLEEMCRERAEVRE